MVKKTPVIADYRELRPEDHEFKACHGPTLGRRRILTFSKPHIIKRLLQESSSVLVGLELG